jgi:hypothetical protein
MVVVETTRGVTTRVRFLSLMLTSLGSKSGTLFYSNYRKRVNTNLKLLPTNPLLLELHAATNRHDMPPLEELWHLRRRVVDLRS